MKIYLAGNCQALSVANILEAGIGIPAERLKPKQTPPPGEEHVLLCQPSYRDLVDGEVILFPLSQTPVVEILQPSVIRNRNTR